MKTYGITKMEMANVGACEVFKAAAENKVSGTLQGMGIIETQRLNEETGELETINICVIKVNDTLYSGTSKVIEGRIKNLAHIVGETTDIEDGKIDIAFKNIELEKGTGTNVIVTRYKE